MNPTAQREQDPIICLGQESSSLYKERLLYISQSLDITWRKRKESEGKEVSSDDWLLLPESVLYAGQCTSHPWSHVILTRATRFTPTAQALSSTPLYILQDPPQTTQLLTPWLGFFCLLDATASLSSETLRNSQV